MTDSSVSKKPTSSANETVLVLDFGGQYTQLIARRVRELEVYCEIVPHEISAKQVQERSPIGVILSGGPESVYAEGAPRLDPAVLELGIPVLGICYGMQLLAQHVGGGVESSGVREYGRTQIALEPKAAESRLLSGLELDQTVWMSHGDKVMSVPSGFVGLAHTESSPIVAFEAERDATGAGLCGIQFHPEVTHTPNGKQMLRNFLYDICGASGGWEMSSYLEQARAAIREQVGDRRVLCGLSGGVDSTVVAQLVKEAIGDQLICVFVDNGLLRKNERIQVETAFRDQLSLPVVVADAGADFLSELEGVTDPETKRKTIGRVFIEVFEREAKKHEGIHFLAQGTLYPDVIESVSVKGPSATIKTHHNVGGLPEKLGFELLEPLRFLFKDEVRALGRELGLPESFVGRHPFPGPGLAVRVLGEVTPERVATLQEADAIFIEELRAAGLYDQVAQALAVLLPIKSVGVMGDFRTYQEVVAIRAVETEDFMTADWSPLPYELLGRVANRIVNEVAGVNRVVYDITSKPPGTIEWE